MTALRLDRRAREFRHDAGPQAWFVLEQLALDAIRDGSALVVLTSVRELAAAVSLNKDTIARAVAVLVRLGVVEHHQPATGGRFGAGRYALQLPDGLTLIDNDAQRPRSRPIRPHATTPVQPTKPAQLTLLDLDADDRSLTLDRGLPTPSQLPDALAPGVSRRPASPVRDTDVSGGTRPRDENGTAARTVRPC